MKTNFKNNAFLQDYHRVLCHHISCILKSSMILDEDMQLLTTFWNPNLIIKSDINFSAYASVACAAAGLLVTVRARNLYPFTVGIVPAALQMSRHMRHCYLERKYKQNFEKLVGSMRELYDLNRNIMEYCHRSDVSPMNATFSVLLMQPRQEFLKQTIMLMILILEKLRDTMLEVSELVPISEGDYIYSLRLDDLKKYDDGNFIEMKRHFEKLNDMYVLIISNFLSCMGLSFCVQLWKETYCDFQCIFNKLIPGLCHFMDLSVQETRMRFNNARFTLPKANNEKKTLKDKLRNSNVLQLQRPLSDFLANLQITFEITRELHLRLGNDGVKYEDFFPVVEEITDQLAICEDSLNDFVRLYSLVSTKRTIAKKVADSLPLPSAESTVSKVEIHYDDPEGLLEDEEYNLSIHGSEGEESMDAICDYADNCSTEHLEVMLFELKRKLHERKAKKSGKLGEGQDKIDIDTPDDTSRLAPQPPPLPSRGESQNGVPPIPPPPVMMHRLPTIDGSHLGFLDAVKNVAQQLNRDEEFQFGFNMFPEIPRPFNTTYRCFSVAMLPGNERQDVERGGKIIMPPSALEQLTRLNINYPMLFKIVNKNTSRTTHCGVLEFVADEGKVYLPLWMMHNLVLEEGDLIQIESVSLPVGTFAKFQPLSPDFLDITNPKAVLENCLRTFACLTSGDVIAVKYNQRVYELCVLETQPGNAISIIECDMNVEFAAPVGYKEYQEVKHAEEDMVVDPADLMPEPSGFVAFRGTGNRLDGKRRKDSGPSDASAPKPVYVRGIPDYDYEIGTLKFLRHFTKSPVSNNKEENEEFKAFSGEGFSLKKRN